MQLNVPPVAIFTTPDTLPVRGIDGARVIQPVDNEERGHREPPAPPRQMTQYRAVPGQPGFMEQRALGRRSLERRRENQNVLLDTRSGRDRRSSMRRERDDAPRALDVKA